MSTRCALVAAIIVFLVTLLARLPARVLVPLLPAQVGCESPGGTIWRGRCGQLRGGMLQLSDFSWRVHPAALLRLRLAAELISADPLASGHASVELSRDEAVRIRDLSAQLPLRNGLAILPRDLAGTVQVSIDDAQLRHGELTALRGFVRVLQLRSESQSADLGSFELRFAPVAAGDPIEGELHDLEGPLWVDGQLRLMRAGGYDLSGSVAARPSASPQLLQALQLLGPPDEQGRRMFSLAGTL